MIAAARLLEPSPTGPLSSTTIRPPRRLSARWYAVLRPVTPAPMITVVGSAILFAIVSARLFGKEPSRMRSPMHGVQPPYRLPSNVVYFHDWRYVNCGAYAW